jgi:hypothetical protein
MNWTPAAQITPLGCCGAFFSERLWLIFSEKVRPVQSLSWHISSLREENLQLGLKGD